MPNRTGFAKCAGVLGLWVAGATVALGQGSFGQIAFGGCWQTTLTLINQSTASVASVRVSFFADDGSPLMAPIDGAGSMSSFVFQVQPGAAQDVRLSSSDVNATEGWANVTSSGDAAIGGQGSFTCHADGRPDFQAVVPLAAAKDSPCLVGFPVTATPVILVPFDNTAGAFTTSLAIVNATAAAQNVSIEFDDPNNQTLLRDTLALQSRQHLAFASTDRYPQLAGKKGVLRIFASPANITVLGLLFNSTGPFTTILPVTQ